MVRTSPTAERGRRSAGRAREDALRILLRVSEGAWASRLLEALDGSAIDPRDISLTHEIVMGVLRWRGLLDRRIGSLCRRGLDTLAPPVREALRIGAYQILFLDRVPRYAAVDGSVELARRGHGPGGAALVNAVLRRLAEEAAENGRTAASAAARPPRAAASGPRGSSARSGSGRKPQFLDARASRDSLAARLAGEVSHPAWMVARALERYGEEEARTRLLANNAPPAVTLHANPLHPDSGRLASRLGSEGVETAPSVLVPGALRVIEGRPVRTRAFAEGAFWIQDEASHLVPLLFPRPMGGLTADLCAAPGGKAFVLATRAAWGPVVAFDLHPQRLRRLVAGARRIAPGRIFAVAADLAAAPPAAEGSFERVLVDAPCSGTGVLRRHPEIRWRLTPSHLVELSILQSRLLDVAFRLLRPGGTLVYSVCSIEEEEGDGVLDAFLARASCRVLDPRPHLPEPARSAVSDDGRLRTSPHSHGTDGFFAALVEKL